MTSPVPPEPLREMFERGRAAFAAYVDRAYANKKDKMPIGMPSYIATRKDFVAHTDLFLDYVAKHMIHILDHDGSLHALLELKSGSGTRGHP